MRQNNIREKIMKIDDRGVVKEYSIPSDSTIKTPAKAGTVRIRKVQVRQKQLAHFGFLSPGGENTNTMNKTIAIITSGTRWYVSYYVLINGKNVRKRAYGRVNAEKDLVKRMALLQALQRAVYESLLNNSDPLHKCKPTIYNICESYIADKELYVKKNTAKTIKRHIKSFQKWLVASQSINKQPFEFLRNDLLTYRNFLLKNGLVNRSVNNALTEISTLFNYVIDSEVYGFFSNPVAKIKKLPSRSEMHVSFTTDQFQDMFDYMKINDPFLLLYVKIIAFSYLRTAETKAIRIGDIDLKARKITLTAKENKTNDRTYKIIQELIVDEFEKRNLSQYPADYFLFSRNGMPGPIELHDEYFRRRFRKIKNKFGLTKYHTIYGFRHTSIGQILESGVKWHDAMKLTGHDSMAAFQKYAQSILGKQPEDHSSSYTVKL